MKTQHRPGVRARKAEKEKQRDRTSPGEALQTAEEPHQTAEEPPTVVESPAPPSGDEGSMSRSS